MTQGRFGMWVPVVAWIKMISFCVRLLGRRSFGTLRPLRFNWSDVLEKQPDDVAQKFELTISTEF